MSPIEAWPERRDGVLIRVVAEIPFASYESDAIGPAFVATPNTSAHEQNSLSVEA